MRFICRFFVAHETTVYTDHRLVTIEASYHARRAKNTTPRSPPIDKSMLRNSDDIKSAFQDEINNNLGEADPEQLDSETISKMIRSVPAAAA